MRPQLLNLILGGFLKCSSLGSGSVPPSLNLCVKESLISLLLLVEIGGSRNHTGAGSAHAESARYPQELADSRI